MNSKILGFAAGFAGITALTSGAFAQTNGATCATDDECPTGQWCPSAHATDPPSATDPQPDPGATEPAVASSTRGALYFPGEGSAACEPIPEGVCESDQDCGAGLECVKAQSSAGCDPSSDGDTSACDTRVITSRYGSCEFAPIECVTNSDCPNGLTCVAMDEPVTDLPVTSSGSGSSSTGSTGTAGSKAAAKYCNYVPEECTTDSDCTADFECVLSEVKACSSTDVLVDCDSESECAAVAQERAAPECEVVSTEGWCLPRKMPCTADAQCPSEYVCYEFEAGQAPDAWNATGNVMSCLPEGLALVAQFVGRDLDGVPVSDSGGKQEGSNLDGQHRLPGRSGDGSACSVSSTQSGSTWLLSVVGLLGLCLVRRRRRAA